ncbi:ABC transporter ATP-binding protein [Nocardia huaxiensis]|uniref:ABC transporter ATP-binding protein n=1 Tax=Nocardia huaxiensis TaxID=2755382 RepID=UPI001E608546|nr:ABC transporter ATP-binding protein [Nocardia huaxiensis]UFS98422.1 ABC transporter ATP-binding protein [Nocardia huaxiensis]
MSDKRTAGPAVALYPVAPDAVPDPALRCRELTRRFGEVVAVDRLSFEIAPGETYGLLGPNGAGKTTVISMVAGILAADAGDITVAGRPMTPRAVAVKSDIGYVPQELALYPDLSARENLAFFAGLYGMSRREIRTRTAQVLETVGLADRADAAVSTLSGGMKRRLNIAAGLLHRPRLLILDEPTVGVDPQSRNAILAGVTALSGEGMSVLYTTHYMEEAERLCDRVGILDGGRMIAEGTPRELTRLVGEHDLVRLAVAGVPARAVDALGREPAVVRAVATGTGIDLFVDDARTALPGLLAVAADAGAAVRSVTVHEPDLEAVFLHLTGKTLRD